MDVKALGTLLLLGHLVHPLLHGGFAGDHHRLTLLKFSRLDKVRSHFLERLQAQPLGGVGTLNSQTAVGKMLARGEGRQLEVLPLASGTEFKVQLRGAGGQGRGGEGREEVGGEGGEFRSRFQ